MSWSREKGWQIWSRKPTRARQRARSVPRYVLGIADDDARDRPEGRIGDDPAQALVHREVHLLQTGSEDPAGLGHRRADQTDIGQIIERRLLDPDMGSGAQDLVGQDGIAAATVLGVTGDHQHRVRTFTAQHLRVVAVGRLGPEDPPGLLGPGRIQVAGSDEVDRQVGQGRKDVAIAVATAADHRQTDPALELGAIGREHGTLLRC